jgi:hypothetical protein
MSRLALGGLCPVLDLGQQGRLDPRCALCRDDHDAKAKAKIIAKQIEVDISAAPVQRHVEVLNEEHDKVAKVPVRPDTNRKAT